MDTQEFVRDLILLRGLPGSGKTTLANTILSVKYTSECDVLSADDSIFAGERQKPIMQKKLNAWIENPSSMPQDDTFKRNFARNKQMVDLSMIPSEIKERIINTFEGQPKKDRSNLINYFMQNKMKQMLELVEEF